MIVGTGVTGTQRMATQIRCKRGNTIIAVASTSLTFGQTSVDVNYKFSRELSDTYYIDENLGSDTTTRTLKKITNQNYVNEKVNSVRINASTNNKITGGAFKIYARRKF